MEGSMNFTYMRGSAAWKAITGALRGGLVAIGLMVVLFVAIEGTRFVTGQQPSESGSVVVPDAETSLQPQHPAQAEAARADAGQRALLAAPTAVMGEDAVSSLVETVEN
jgi:hypothetical protein